MYNTTEEVDRFADGPGEDRGRGGAGRTRPVAVPAPPVGSRPIPRPSAASPQEAAEELAEVFEFLDDWAERYQHIIELGEKLPPMPAALKTEANRVRGCQSTVFLHGPQEARARRTCSSSWPTATPIWCAA